MKNSEGPIITVYRDRVTWQQKYTFDSGPASKASFDARIPSQIVDHTVWGSKDLLIETSEVTPSKVDILMAGDEIEYEALSEIGGHSSAASEGYHLDTSILHVNKSRMIRTLHDKWSAIKIVFGLRVKGKHQLTVLAVLPKLRWDRSYTLVFLNEPKFSVDEGFTVTTASVSKISSLDSWRYPQADNATLILNRSKMESGRSGTQKRMMRGGRPEAMMMSDEAPPAVVQKAPPAQVFQNQRLSPGAQVQRQTSEGTVFLPFSTVYDHQSRDDALVNVLDIGSEELKGDLKNIFLLDPAPVRIVDESGTLMASGIVPTGSEGVLPINSVEGVSVARRTRGTSRDQQPQQTIEIFFDNQRSAPVKLEVWEKSGSRVQLKSQNENITVDSPGGTYAPDEVDGNISVPIIIGTGTSRLVYDIFYYNRR